MLSNHICVKHGIRGGFIVILLRLSITFLFDISSVLLQHLIHISAFEYDRCALLIESLPALNVVYRAVIIEPFSVGLHHDVALLDDEF